MSDEAHSARARGISLCALRVSLSDSFNLGAEIHKFIFRLSSVARAPLLASRIHFRIITC
jgi:hypothetical protein